MRSPNPTPLLTKMHRVSPRVKTKFSFPSVIQCIFTSPSSVLGDAAQKLFNPCCLANASMLMASSVDRLWCDRPIIGFEFRVEGEYLNVMRSR